MVSEMQVRQDMEMKRVNDIIAEYPGEWVAVEVVEYGIPPTSSGDRDFGKLMAHSVDEEEVLDAITGHTSLIAFEYSGPQVEPGYVLLL